MNTRKWWTEVNQVTSTVWNKIFAVSYLCDVCVSFYLFLRKKFSPQKLTPLTELCRHTTCRPKNLGAIYLKRLFRSGTLKTRVICFKWYPGAKREKVVLVMEWYWLLCFTSHFSLSLEVKWKKNPKCCNSSLNARLLDNHKNYYPARMNEWRSGWTNECLCSLSTVPCSYNTVYPWAMASVTYPSFPAAVLRVSGPETRMVPLLDLRNPQDVILRI